MAIQLDILRRAATRQKPQRLAKSLTEALAKAQATAFLCHSHDDETLAKGLQILMAEHGCDLYIDWEDATMPPQPNRQTAAKIKQQIDRLDWFLFLATPNSVISRWCPWEIGYADSQKALDRILLFRTTEAGKFYGNEYLNLYRQVTFSDAGKLMAFPAGQRTGGVLVERLG